jgi:hypothetical protein
MSHCEALEVVPIGEISNSDRRTQKNQLLRAQFERDGAHSIRFDLSHLAAAKFQHPRNHLARKTALWEIGWGGWTGKREQLAPLLHLLAAGRFNCF